MYLTEEEARKKWCPQVRDLHESNSGTMTSANRAATDIEHTGVTGQKGFCCIASECMMWRWKRWEYRGNVDKVKDEEILNHGSLGYCGLGGKP